MNDWTLLLEIIKLGLNNKECLAEMIFEFEHDSLEIKPLPNGSSVRIYFDKNLTLDFMFFTLILPYYIK